MVTSMTNPQAEAMSSNASRAKEDTYPALPKGNYTLVSVDIDTTGRRLIDEVKIYYYYISTHKKRSLKSF